MKNTIKQLIQFFIKYFRKRQLKKREDIYDDVIAKLKPKLELKKQQQQDLIDSIVKQFPKHVGIYQGSKFIPATGKNEAEIYHTLMNKYGDELADNKLELTLDLKFKCI